jgi:diguanylate cyclase (GGDEF)-like protein/PAS domain S-box-containing protein
MPLRVLLLDDVPLEAELLIHELRKAGIALDARLVSNAEEFAAALQKPPDIIISDYALPGFGVPQAMEMVRARNLDVPVVIVTGTLRDEDAACCMRLGVADYLLKDRLARLPEAVLQALEKKRLKEQQTQSELALRRSQRLHEVIVASALDCIITIDRRGLIVDFNPAAERTFGYAKAHVVGNAMVDLIVPVALRDAHCRGFARLLDTGEGRILGKRIEMTALRADGSEFPIEFTVAITGSWDEPLFTATIRDISERRLAEAKIRRLNRVHAVLSGINGVIVRVRDRSKILEEACRIAVEHGGFPLAWIGRLDHETLDVLPVAVAGVHEPEAFELPDTIRQDLPAGGAELGRALREKRPVVENDIEAHQDIGGPRRQLALKHGLKSLIALPLFIEEGLFGNLSLFAREPGFFDEEEVRLLRELAADISFALEHAEKTERAQYLAYYDALTDLPNRTLFLERLQQEINSARQSQPNVCLVLADLRRLRLMNESMGRQAGDALVREVANRFKRVWPQPDRVARIAGDCLAATLSDMRDATEVGRLLDGPVDCAIAAPFMLEGREFRFSMTFGIAVYPADGPNAETLLRNADAALNRAKQAGEHYLFYQPGMNAEVTESLLLRGKLRQAIANNQLVLHYQPKIAVENGSVSGVEALLRWMDPDSGLVPPDRFIPLLEDSGMIVEAGQWAIGKAAEDYGEWLTIMERPPRIAVNVSAVQLRRGDLPGVVRKALEKQNLASHGLDLEITESMVMDDVEASIVRLRALRELGVAIAMDDFGTGYSSLAYLAKLPLNSLKIDRSFITTMIDNIDSMTIVSTIISLARALKLKVIAEGVESEEQARLLRLLRCDELQGYLFARPMPADELVRYLRKQPAQYGFR